MPRKPRIEYVGAFYHVMCRGDRRETVFRDNRDNEMFLETLGEACGRCGWLVHAYVLMRNHYHMLLETPEPNLVAGMQWLQGAYTTRYNVRRRECGHLFQGRYKALPVSGQGEYFTLVASYIHLNPARIKGYNFMRSSLEEYRWSSYPAYVQRAQKPEWLCLERVLAGCGLADTEGGRRKYGLLMRKKVSEMSRSAEPWGTDDEWDRIRRGWCIGDDTFHEEMAQLLAGTLKGKRRDSYSGESVERHDAMMAERLIKLGLEALGISEDMLANQAKGSAEKYALAWLARKNTCIKNGWIKARLRMGSATNFSSRLHLVETAGEGDWGYDARNKLKTIRI